MVYYSGIRTGSFLNTLRKFHIMEFQNTTAYAVYTIYPYFLPFGASPLRVGNMDIYWLLPQYFTRQLYWLAHLYTSILPYPNLRLTKSQA